MERSGLRILVFQKFPGIWVARGLEHDLAVEARSLPTAIDRIHRLVLAHVEFDRRHGRIPLSPFPAAPQRFWSAFDHATRLPAWKNDRGPAESELGPIVVAVLSELPTESIVRSPFDRSLRSARHGGVAPAVSPVARSGRPIH